MRFDDDGFVLVRELIPSEICDEIYKHLLDEKENYYRKAIVNVSNFYCIVDDALCTYKENRITKLQHDILPIIEHHVTKKLYVTYNFLRYYHSGSIMPKHTDRPSCEYSISLHLGDDGTNTWPLWIKSLADDKVYNFILNVGDAIIYKGCECEHWRENPVGKFENFCQAFLHYVDKKGLYTDYIEDLPLLKRDIEGI